MKKNLVLLIFTLICFSFVSKAFSQQTLTYNGGSGEQIPVTYDGYYLTVGTLPAPYPHLRVDWELPGGGTYSEYVSPGGSFTRYSNYNFRISGYYWDGTTYISSLSYYIWQ